MTGHLDPEEFIKDYFIDSLLDVSALTACV